MIYTSCIEQFWDSAKVETVNGDVRLQALVDGKKIIVNEASIRRDLRLDDAEEKDTRFLMYPRFVQVFVNQQLGDMSKHKRIFVNPSHTKKVFGNMKREGKGFSGALTPLFKTVMVKAHEDIGKGSEIPADLHPTPIVTQSLSFQPRKNKNQGGNRGRKLRIIADIDDEEGVTLVDETQERNDQDMFDTSVLDDEVVAEKEVSTANPVTTAGEVVTTADVETLIEIKAAKPKAVTTASTTIVPKAKGIVMKEPEETTIRTTTTVPSQSLKDKGKAKMVEFENP
nr:hypothetical protein [Tanacetum cinerariifolium]